MSLELTHSKTRPEHVPADLAFDFDMYVLPEEFSDDPHAYWKAVQENYPSIFWTPAYGGHWVVTRGEDIKRISIDYENFSNVGAFIPKGVSPVLIPSHVDPPEHRLYRKILNPSFTPKALEKLESKAREFAIEIIEELAPKGECEFVRDFSSVMPVVAFLTLAGLPIADREMLQRWGDMMTPMNGPDAAEGWANVTNYVKGWIAKFKEQPGEGLISDVVHAKIDDRPLSDDEILSMCQLIVAGGLDTVLLMTSFTARHLAQNPADREYLRNNPDKIMTAVDEFARRFGTSNLARNLTTDLEYSGLQFKNGEQVMLPFPLYGLDDHIHKDPMTIDFDRAMPRNHTSFGSGPHLCVGQQLARREIKIFLEEWLNRIPDFEIKPGTKPTCSTGIINTITDLQLVWNS